MKKKIIPAAAFHMLTPFYDIVAALGGFGVGFKKKVVALANITSREKILDVGCGTGALIAEIKKQFSATDVTGIDPDPDILALAAKKLANADLRANLIETSADSLPFPAASFDLAVSTLVFHHLPAETKKKAISEARRVLKPTGRLLLVDFGKPASFTARILLFLGSFIDGRENMRENLEGRIPTLLSEAGFHVQEIEPPYHGVHFLLAEKKDS